MAYQPLFITVEDKYGNTIQTRSRRGHHNWFRLWCNSKFGEVGTITFESHDGHDRVERPDLRRVPKDQRQQVMAEYHEEVDSHSCVIVDMSLQKNAQVILRVNGKDEIHLVEELRAFISDDVVLGDDLPYWCWVGLLPEFVTLNKSKDKPTYDDALTAFMARRDALLAKVRNTR